jgi:putative membrane protein
MHLDPAETLTWWTPDPLAIGTFVVSSAIYVRGTRRLWRTVGVGHGIRRWEALCFALGQITLLLALVSPIDRLSDLLFSAHMTQHEIIMVVAPPLFVLGRPGVALAWAFPRIGRATWRLGSAPALALVAHALVVWLWHVPVLFEAALRSEAVHAVQHASFFGTAALFWWSIVRGRYGRLGYGLAVVFVFATAMHTSILGALLTVAEHVWYPMYTERGEAVGMDPVADQQLAGLVMWVPAGVVFVLAALGLFAAWLGESARRVARAERRRARAAVVTSTLLTLALFASGCDDKHARAAMITGGDPGRGREEVREHGCGSCHTIPGVPGATAIVGPPLTGIARRAYIAGALPNTPANMRAWITHPQKVKPNNAMPDVPMTDEDARDITAYLYTLD